MFSKLIVVCMLIVLQTIVGAHAYYITVDAHSEECFFDRVEAGTKMGTQTHRQYPENNISFLHL